MSLFHKNLSGFCNRLYLYILRVVVADLQELSGKIKMYLKIKYLIELNKSMRNKRKLIDLKKMIKLN